MKIEPITIPARDGFSLAATRYEPESSPTNTAVTISSATAVPQRFYRHFAAFLAGQGHTTVTYDYRGISGSRPETLRGVAVQARDWALLDMAGVIDWVQENYQPKRSGRSLSNGWNRLSRSSGILSAPQAYLLSTAWLQNFRFLNL